MGAVRERARFVATLIRCWCVLCVRALLSVCACVCMCVCLCVHVCVLLALVNTTAEFTITAFDANGNLCTNVDPHVSTHTHNTHTQSTHIHTSHVCQVGTHNTHSTYTHTHTYTHIYNTKQRAAHLCNIAGRVRVPSLPPHGP